MRVLILKVHEVCDVQSNVDEVDDKPMVRIIDPQHKNRPALLLI